MIILVLLNIIVQGTLIFPNQPHKVKEIKWIQCAPPNSPYNFSLDNTLPQYYLIDEKAICENNTDEYDITQNNFDQLWYYFVFANNIQKELIISIDGIIYYIDVVKLNKKNEVVIRHTHEYLNGQRFPISIQGMNNQFQQLYIFLLNNKTPTINKIIYNETKNPIESEKLEKMELLKFESNILEQQYIFIAFTFQLRKPESLLCQFNILEQDNVSLHSYNDSLIQLTSKSEIQKKHRLADFILRVQSFVQIKQIFAGNFLDIQSQFDLIIQTDGQNNVIQSFLNESNEKLTLSSDMQIQNFPNQTLIIEIKPKGIKCPQNLKMTIIHLEIANNNYIQFQYSNLHNCKKIIQHQFNDIGQYLVVLVVKLEIQDVQDSLSFYLENQSSFTIHYIKKIEYNLEIVLYVFFGTIILFIFVFIGFFKKYGVKIYSKLDTIFFRAIYIEEENQNFQ